MSLDKMTAKELEHRRDEEAGQLYEDIIRAINPTNLISYSEIIGVLEIIKSETMTAFYEQNNKRG